MTYASHQHAQILADEAKYIAPAQKIPYLPVPLARGEGALLYDYYGNRYIDMLSSGSSANIGHGNTEIADAVYAQMKQLAQYAMIYFPVREPVELARQLVMLSGKQDMKVAFSASGSAAIDGAIKYARAFTGRNRIIAFHESYHGSTIGAMSVSALSNSMRRGLGPLMPEVYHFHYPACARCPFVLRQDTCAINCLRDIEYAFQYYLPPEEVAAVIMEPIAGDAGLAVPSVRYVQALRALLDQHGILLVSDEIQQGLGRAGSLFCMDRYGIESDLYVLGKSLGAGLPMGALLGRAEILNSISAPGHVFTLSGCSAVAVGALKMLEIMERDGLFGASIQKGAYLMEQLLALKKKHPTIGDVRGMGLSIGVDLVSDPVTMEKSHAAAAKVCHYCIQHGVLLTFIGRNVLRVQPPLVITYEEMDTFVAVLGDALAALECGRLGDELLDEIGGW